jgi:hypothetical protein
MELDKDCVVVLTYNRNKQLTSERMDWCQATHFASQLNKDLNLRLRKIGGIGQYRYRGIEGVWDHTVYPQLDVIRVGGFYED